MAHKTAREAKTSYRKPYRTPNKPTSACHNHGSCEHCKRNRTHATKRRTPIEGLNRLQQPL